MGPGIILYFFFIKMLIILTGLGIRYIIKVF
jgi:hypothetical protein